MFFVLTSFVLSLAAGAAHACFKSPPAFETLKDGAEYVHVELDPHWREAPVEIGKHLGDLRGKAEALANIDPIQLLKRQLKFFKDSSPEHSAIKHFINGDFGRVRGIGCVEAAMLDLHLQKHLPQTEFLAVIMSKERHFAIHAMTWGEFAAVSKSDSFNDWIDELVMEGWEAQILLHNHPFILGGDDIGGTIMASQVDVNVFKDRVMRWGLKSAWITNGFHTAKFRHDEFPNMGKEWEINTASDPRFWR